MRQKNTFQMSFRFSGGQGMIEHCPLSHTFYEFFAGSGMVRAGLGDSWKCLFSNDLDDKKAAAYQENWGDGEILVEDVARLDSHQLPGQADLAWASFPCQDLSLAGSGAGLKGNRSGTFWPFWNLVRELHHEGRRPKIVVLENVCGALTSHNGADFRSLIKAFNSEGYRAGALVIDAALFVPQSRPRLFIVGVRNDIEIDSHLVTERPQMPFHNAGVITAYRALPSANRASWIWWNLPVPPARTLKFSSVVENDVPWHTDEQTRSILALMSPLHLAKLAVAKREKKMVVGTIYKRTRPDHQGRRTQRAEVRFDDIAGCLRTPGGGSSRQTIVVVQGSKVRTRLLTPREAARLMGLPDEYVLPKNYNDAYRLMGDGVVVPVVRHLSRYLLESLVQIKKSAIEQAA
jgi:DNA (cytosine-5)-methyltransferase 1